MPGFRRIYASCEGVSYFVHGSVKWAWLMYGKTSSFPISALKVCTIEGFLHWNGVIKIMGSGWIQMSVRTAFFDHQLATLRAHILHAMRLQNYAFK